MSAMRALGVPPTLKLASSRFCGARAFAGCAGDVRVLLLICVCCCAADTIDKDECAGAICRSFHMLMYRRYMQRRGSMSHLLLHRQSLWSSLRLCVVSLPGCVRKCREGVQRPRLRKHVIISEPPRRLGLDLAAFVDLPQVMSGMPEVMILRMTLLYGRVHINSSNYGIN